VQIDDWLVAQDCQRRGTFLPITPGQARRQRRPDIEQTVADLGCQRGTVEFPDVALHHESPTPPPDGADCGNAVTISFPVPVRTAAMSCNSGDIQN
jgi:hypothetical protein